MRSEGLTLSIPIVPDILPEQAGEQHTPAARASSARQADGHPEACRMDGDVANKSETGESSIFLPGRILSAQPAPSLPRTIRDGPSTQVSQSHSPPLGYY